MGNTLVYHVNPDDFKSFLHKIVWHGLCLLMEVKGHVETINPFVAVYQKIKASLFRSFGAIDYTQTELVKRSVRNILVEGAKNHLLSENDTNLAKEIAKSAGLPEKQIEHLIDKVIEYTEAEEQVASQDKIVTSSYEQGRGSTDLAKIKEMAKNGMREAMFLLAKQYDEDLVLGIEHKDSKAQAVKWYHRASLLGDNEAMLALASIYTRENAWDSDALGSVEEALNLYKKASTKGSVKAMLELGMLYGGGGLKNLSTQEADIQAAKWYYKAAALGSSDAMYKLALMYESGRIKELQDSSLDTHAVKWYEKAATLNQPRAMYNLARMYERGSVPNVERNKALELAKDLYQKASKIGNVNAMIRLSQMYKAGMVPSIDSEVAKEKSLYWNKEAKAAINLRRGK